MNISLQFQLVKVIQDEIVLYVDMFVRGRLRNMYNVVLLHYTNEPVSQK